MYDINQQEFLEHITVRELIGKLSKLPQNASFVLCGDTCGYIHVETDGSVVNLDNSSLEDEYEIGEEKE